MIAIVAAITVVVVVLFTASKLMADDVGEVTGASDTLTYVVANELPYESSPRNVAVTVY